MALRRRARHAVAEAVANLADHARAGRAPQFYAALNDALQGQLSLTLGGNPGSYTEDIIDGKLTSRGLGEEDATRLRALFGLLAQARFSPGSVSGDLVARQLDAEAALAALRRLEEAS